MTTITRPTPGEVEERTALDTPIPIVDGRRLHGVIPYGVESRDLGGFTEIIEPGALSDADLSELIATREHDRSKLLGRHPSTLTVEDRSDGFAWSVELPQSPVGEDVRVAIERGDLRSTSWRMVVAEDEWRGDVRHVKRIAELRDVTVTAAPAYGDYAPAEYRSSPEPSTTPPPEETTVKTESRTENVEGGLRVEERAAAADTPDIATRVMDEIRSVSKGESRALSTASGSGRPITPTEQATFVWDKLRASAVMLAAGVPVLPTDKREIQWPQITADVDPDWYAEMEEILAGDPGLGTLTATPRKLAHRVEFSNEVLDDSEPEAADVVSNHLATMLAIKLDYSMLYGNPTANADSIRGLRYVAGIQSISMGTNGAALTNYDPFVRAVGLLKAANVPGPYVAVLNPRTGTDLSLLKTTTNEPLPRPSDVPPFYETTSIPTNETKGTATNASSAFVFAPSALLLVRRLVAEILLDRSRLFSKDMSEMRAKTRADLLVPNPVAVVRIDGITPSA